MSELTVMAVHKDDESADDTPRPNVASLVSRFSQRKPMGLQTNSPTDSSRQSTPQSGKIPPKAPPKPAKRTGLQRAATLPTSHTEPDTEAENKQQLASRLSVSDLAKSLGSSISFGVEKQIKKNQPVSKSSEMSSNRAQDTQQTVHLSHTDDKTSVTDNRTSDSEIISDSCTSVSERSGLVQDVSNVSSDENSHATDSNNPFSQTVENNTTTHSGNTLRGTTPEIPQTSANIGVSTGTEVGNYFFNDDVDFINLIGVTGSQHVSSVQQTSLQQSQFRTDANDILYVPSPPVEVPLPPLMDAPPPYDPAGWSDTGVTGSDSSGQRRSLGGGPHLSVATNPTSSSILSVTPQVGADTGATLPLHSAGQRQSVTSRPPPGFDDDFVPLNQASEETPQPTKPSVILFHTVCGRNASISPDRTQAWRRQTGYLNAYVFTATPVGPGQEIVLKVFDVDSLSRLNGLAFGLTACDPATVSPTTLPDDAYLLLDRSEYWVVVQDVCLNPAVGDELCISITEDGAVQYSRNGTRPSTLMHVDYTVPLWAFLDISGHALKIQSIAPSARSKICRTSAPDPPSSKKVNPAEGHLRQGQGDTPKDEERHDECTVCFERTIDTVLYMCGHMCMCYECAVIMKAQREGLCPICRQTISEVIKVYRS